MSQKISINRKIKYEKELFKAFKQYDNKNDIIYEIMNNIDFPIKNKIITLKIATSIYNITKKKYEKKYNNKYKFKANKYAKNKY
tara:strand:+ start:75 stop:326 length:252 start_codon:yes stop_codon:yes gene_type:complete